MTDAAFPLPGTTTVSTIGDWEDLFWPGMVSGVIPGDGNEMAPSLDTSGRNVIIATGHAILRAFCKPISAPTAVPIPAASSQDRIDRLVLRLDRSQTVADNFVVPTVITGTPAANPQIPAFTRTPTGIWDLPIAYWTSAASGTRTGLVPELEFVANVICGYSTTHHTPERPGLRIDRDTGTLWMSTNGTSWDTKVYAPEDAWRNFNPLTTGFEVNPNGGQAKYRLTRDNEVQLSAWLQIAAKAGPGLSFQQITQNPLDAGYRPASSKYFALSGTAAALWQSNYPAIPTGQLAPNGHIYLYGLPAGLSQPCNVGINCKLPLDI